MVRLAWEGEDAQTVSRASGRIAIRNGQLVKSRNYFFEQEWDFWDAENQTYEISTNLHNPDVVALWLDDVDEDSTIEIDLNSEKIEISLNQLLNQDEINKSYDGITLTVNLLFDREIGVINPINYGIKTDGDNFRFLILADPQGGNPDDVTNDSITRLKIHNAFIEECVRVSNELEPRGVFSVILGDFVDSQAQKSNFDRMLEYYGRLNGPKLLAVGNHETAYSATFRPGYNMSSLDNYFAAQKTLNGMDEILYSFDLGRWHFIVWPDPLRNDFWETHPHYFEWLERDLEMNSDKPVMFMNHIPLQPIGINPLVNYVESVDVKRTILDILARHGNVKYVLSGHVHIPLKAAIKTSVEYKGMQLINLPAAGYRPRAFGEEDYFGGPSQAIVYIDIHGEDAEINFKTVTNEVLQCNRQFPELDTEKYKLWLSHKWELPAGPELKNGFFTNGLEHWTPRFVYREDENPSNKIEVQAEAGINRSPALYLYNKVRGFRTTGQDRMHQTINRVCQAVTITPGSYPVLETILQPDQNYVNPNAMAAAYIWVEGFDQSLKKMNLVYSVGKMYGYLDGKYSQVQNIGPSHFNLPAAHGEWNEVYLNIFEDHQKRTGSIPSIDRLVINLGVCTINDGINHECGIYFNNIDLKSFSEMPDLHSRTGQQMVEQKSGDDLWYFRNNHTAGEHQYATQGQLYSTLADKNPEI